jgi:DNA-binding transcriptional LysR family regulator
MEEALNRAGTRPQVVFRSVSNETLFAMVRSGMGFAILPQLAVAGAQATGDSRLEIHRLDHDISREVWLHWPAHRTLSPLATRAIEIARELASHPDTAETAP